MISASRHEAGYQLVAEGTDVATGRLVAAVSSGYRARRWDVGKPSVLMANPVQRRFTATKPNAAWVTDITYIRTWQGWLYLAVVMDLFSRMTVGWAATPTIHRELVLNAVMLAVRRRRPRGTWIHSDQGTQFSVSTKSWELQSASA